MVERRSTEGWGEVRARERAFFEGFMRPCSVKPLLEGIGEVWRGLSEILTCMGFNPPQSTSIPFNFVATEQALKDRNVKHCHRFPALEKAVVLVRLATPVQFNPTVSPKPGKKNHERNDIH